MRLKPFWKKASSVKEVAQEAKNSCTATTGGQQQILLQGNDFLNFAIGYGNGLTGYENLSYDRAMQFYQQSSAVATAVDISSQEASRIKPVLRTPDGKFEDSSEILGKLMNPNDWNESWSFFFGSMCKSRLITGDAFTYASGIVTRPPIELYSLKPQNVNNITGTTDYRPTNFTVYVGDGQGSYSRTAPKKSNQGIRFYDGNLKELWHTMGYSSNQSNFRGDSPLAAICLDINSQIKGRLHNVKLLDNGARPSMMVLFKDTITQDQHLQRKQVLNEQVAGASNAGAIMTVTAPDMEVHEMGMSNKDMDYESLERIADTAIYRRYRIPLPLVFNDAATDNNMAHSVYQLYDFAVLPLVDEMLSSLSMFLLPRYGLDPAEYQLTYNPDEIEALKQRRIETLQARKNLGIESYNELREGLPNREPVENGDVILINSTQIPLGEVSTEPEENTMTAEEEAAALAERDGIDV